MGSLLASILANIIMTESTIIKKLVDIEKIIFYCGYVNDTLLLIKPEDIQLLQDFFHSFHENLCLTVDRFEN